MVRRRPGQPGGRIPAETDHAGSEFAAKKTAKSGEKLNKAKTDMAAAVQKWAIDSG